MTRRVRIALFAPALAVFAALLVWGFAGLPDFGHFHGSYGLLLNRVGVVDRHTTNVVGATVFDYRGFDTLGEEFILFTAVMGVVLLLRGQREKPDTSVESTGSDAVRVGGLLLVGPVVLVGLWLAAFGYITPGGGFQGGVVVGSALLLLFLAWNYRGWHAVISIRTVDPVEGLGAGGFVVVGLAALASGPPFLQNLFGTGKTGTLTSGGSIAFVNWAVAIEVAAATLLLYAEFLSTYVTPLRGGRLS